MKILFLYFLGQLVISSAITQEELAEISEQCCAHGEAYGKQSSDQGPDGCSNAVPPDEVAVEHSHICLVSMDSCCKEYFKQVDDCSSGIASASKKNCNDLSSDIEMNCCEELSLGSLSGESQGIAGCPSGFLDNELDSISTSYMLRKNAFRKCCLDAASLPDVSTTEINKETTRVTKESLSPCEESKANCSHICVPDENSYRCYCDPGYKLLDDAKSCQKIQQNRCIDKNPCEHTCTDDGENIRCGCRKGYKLAKDMTSCKDINECALDIVSCSEGSVCHNTPGSYRCVPVKKREVTPTCPAGFKRNIQNQVCDDINECQLPRPPCPKYLCENTIGGYKCGGKPGIPATEPTLGASPVTPAVPAAIAPTPKEDDPCPTGFRAGPESDCIDINECEERLDDCQRLSQHCINTHGSYFCQNHGSKRCTPGFQINLATGICEDIDECVDSDALCRRNQVCVNLPGAYNCKSKISTLPKLSRKTCQEGTRIRPGGTVCEDIDECREGTHLCDQFQNCINTYGGHECRCKPGFEMDSSTSSCIDINECETNQDNCRSGYHCLNTLGSYTCTRSIVTSTAPYEYEYYDSEDETTRNVKVRVSTTPKHVTVASTNKPPRRPQHYPRQTTSLPPTSIARLNPGPKPNEPIDNNVTIDPAAFTNKPPRVAITTPKLGPVPVTENSPKYPQLPRTVTVSSPVEHETAINPEDYPKNRWTNVIGKEPEPNLDRDLKHCLPGYEKNTNGDCVDTDECANGSHMCSQVEKCVNRQGGYMCDCAKQYQRDALGQCILIMTTPRTTTSTTSTTQRTTTSTTRRPTTSRTIETTPNRPQWRPYTPRIECELGYHYDGSVGKCIDIDECVTDRASCSSDERCLNTDGGYRCVCRSRQRCLTPDTANNTPNHVVPRPDTGTMTNTITIGSQYGQQGPRQVAPIYRRTPNNSGVFTTCTWGYKLTMDNRCLDVDECAVDVNECGPQQNCENFYGGYSCQCPPGHKLVRNNQCEDIDECQQGHPCSMHASCINTVGSYKCACGDGFRNAPSNEKVCIDVDECSEDAGICQHACSNAWGSYRCTCHRGYRLNNDNRTCVDIDECKEYSGRLCTGECNNIPGSYRCSCPRGFRLSADEHSCIDINECETGEASCASNSNPELVCQNTRGGYHCHRITCPSGYRLEQKHRCSRIQRSCLLTDWGCLHQPGTYTYNFITFQSKIFLQSGRIDLFTMRGPSWNDAVLDFELKLTDVQARDGVQGAMIGCFDMRPTANMCLVSLLCSLQGPQVDELELTMSLYRGGQFAGSAVAKLIIIVSEYEY